MNNIESAKLSPARKSLIEYLNRCRKESKDPNYLEFSKSFLQKSDSDPEVDTILEELAQLRIFKLLDNNKDAVKLWIDEHTKNWYKAQGGECPESRLERKIATDLAHDYFPGNNEMEILANEYPGLFGLYAAKWSEENYKKNKFKSDRS